MPSRKTSPKREINYEPAMKAGKYGAMASFYLVVIAAITACVFFIVYAAESHGVDSNDSYIDPYEHDFGRMTISAYATIIALLAAILILMFYMTYLAHKHFHH